VPLLIAEDVLGDDPLIAVTAVRGEFCTSAELAVARDEAVGGDGSADAVLPRGENAPGQGSPAEAANTGNDAAPDAGTTPAASARLDGTCVAAALLLIDSVGAVFSLASPPPPHPAAIKQAKSALEISIPRLVFGDLSSRMPSVSAYGLKNEELKCIHLRRSCWGKGRKTSPNCHISMRTLEVLLPLIGHFVECARVARLVTTRKSGGPLQKKMVEGSVIRTPPVG